MQRQKLRSNRKKKFGHRNGRSSCAHSIGKFFLCYIVLFSFETSATGSPGNYLYHCTGFNLQRILSSQTCHTLHIGSCHIASCRWYHTISVQLCSIYTFKDMLWVRELAREPLSLWSPQDIPQDVTASWNLLDAHKPRPEWSVFPTGSELQHFWLRTLSCKLPLQSILIKVLKMWKTLLCRRDPKFIEGHRLA